MTPHTLRHTAATLLLARGVHPKLVQELLGHASIALTLDRYSHWTPSMGEQTLAEAAERFGMSELEAAAYDRLGVSLV